MSSPVAVGDTHDDAHATELVRWAIAAFMSNPQADLDALTAIVTRAGLPDAERVLSFVQLAFGRRILDGLVELSPTFFERDATGADVERRFADEALFVAGREEAHRATKDQLERIGFGSPELDAVNHALHTGSKPEDLVVSPPRLVFGKGEDIILPTVGHVLREVVRAHGVDLPLEARIYPSVLRAGRAQMQLDVIVRVGERELVESFAGLGDSIRTAIEQAVDKFTNGTLHVLLATLVGPSHGADQVTWESCGAFRLCSGPLLRMWAQSPRVDYAAVLDAIKVAVTGAELSHELHWVRVFVAVGIEREILGHDALLDGEPWAPVVELVKAWPWPGGESEYALRHFFMLVPSEDHALPN